MSDNTCNCDQHTRQGDPSTHKCLTCGKYMPGKEPKTTTLRGHAVYEDEGGTFRFCDTNEPTESTWFNRPCGKCGKYGSSNDGLPDPCLGNLPGVTNACCGHGDPSQAYICFSGGIRIHGFTVDQPTPIPQPSQPEAERWKVHKRHGNVEPYTFYHVESADAPLGIVHTNESTAIEHAAALNEVDRLRQAYSALLGVFAAVGIPEPIEGFVERPQDVLRCVKELRQRVAELERYKEDVEDAAKAARNESCDMSQKHCSCVPLLRQQLAAKDEQVERLSRAIQNIAVCYDNLCKQEESGDEKSSLDADFDLSIAIECSRKLGLAIIASQPAPTLDEAAELMAGPEVSPIDDDKLVEMSRQIAAGNKPADIDATGGETNEGK